MRGGQNRLSAEEHRKRGTFRPDRVARYAPSPAALRLVSEVLAASGGDGAIENELCELVAVFDRTVEAFAAYFVARGTGDPEQIQSTRGVFDEMNLALQVRLRQSMGAGMTDGLALSAPYHET